MPRDTFLRNILIVSVAAVLILPIYTALYTYPSFKQMLISYTEETAERLTLHLSNEMFPEGKELRKDLLTGAFFKGTENVIKDFKLMKIKVFSPTGEITYSTESKDIGKVNKERYFSEFVAKGKKYTTEL
ncbi:MAG: hypothetical protein FD174_4219 [Geobacteraceae bacterium]|nr:MAG: hypothetical protein FD174_4219 [Geobacteraceae bacterium]